MVKKRGAIHWASLADPRGSEPGFRRPVVIVSSDAFNRSEISTVLVAVITSNIHLKAAPGNVFLPRGSSGLPKDSVINISQIITLDKNFLDDPVACLPENLMQQLEKGLRLVFSLAS